MSVHVDCAACSIEFCISDDTYARRKRDHRSFYCPNGHKNYYPQQTDEERVIAELRSQIADLKERVMPRLRMQRHAAERLSRTCPWPACRQLKPFSRRDNYLRHLQQHHGMPKRYQWARTRREHLGVVS